MRYTALTTSGPFDIGEFPDQATAERYAHETYGDSFQAVMVQQNDTVTVTADPSPTSLGWLVFVAAAAFTYYSTLVKPRRKAR